MDRDRWEVRNWERGGRENSGCLASREEGRWGEEAAAERKMRARKKLYFPKMRDLTFCLLKED